MEKTKTSATVVVSTSGEHVVLVGVAAQRSMMSSTYCTSSAWALHGQRLGMALRTENRRDGRTRTVHIASAALVLQ